MIREGVMISGRYEIMGRIGTGGMADVYRAIDRKLNRYVAIKVLKREFREDETFVKKFQTEAQSAAGLQHPNIVSVYDVGDDRGLYYIVMELIEGITLKEYIQKKGRLTPKEVISTAVQVCSAMEMAHSRNIIHRDIKPQNIMISKEGKVKVTDFGIAKATSSNTISTNAMGSVHYTSPEQARGGFSDAKSDIYSLGISMYEMITGKLPFDGDSTVSIALKHLQEDILLPSEVVPNIPYSLEQIILKCTQKSPNRRYVEIGQLEKDLRRSLSDPDGDFVVIAPFDGSETRMITPEELSNIQKAAEYDEYGSDYDYDDDDEYEARRARRREENKKDIDPKVAKIMKILTWVVVAIFAFILIFVGAKALGLFSGSENPGTTQNKEEKVVVPTLVGMSLEEAEAECDELGLKLKVKDKVESKKQEEGYIDSQRTAANVKVPKGAIIQVVVSSGKLVEIPKLEDKDYVDARDKLIDMGFKKENITLAEESHDTIEEDNVTRTDPEAGEWLSKNGKITIYVSTGVKIIKMPNLLGLTKEEAEKALTELGLVGNAIEEYSTEAVGVVIEQKTDYGEEMKAGTVVEYVVSKGEKPKDLVTVPSNLTGKTGEYVRGQLEALGFKVTTIEDYNDQVQAGKVSAVEEEGNKVEKGSTIKIWVSLGPESE